MALGVRLVNGAFTFTMSFCGVPFKGVLVAAWLNLATFNGLYAELISELPRPESSSKIGYDETEFVDNCECVGEVKCQFGEVALDGEHNEEVDEEHDDKDGVEDRAEGDTDFGCEDADADEWLDWVVATRCLRFNLPI